MTLHPELRAMLRDSVLPPSDADLTAFAVAVAQAERERCANWLCTTIPPLYDLAGAMIDGLPNPEWAGDTDA